MLETLLFRIAGRNQRCRPRVSVDAGSPIEQSSWCCRIGDGAEAKGGLLAWVLALRLREPRLLAQRLNVAHRQAAHEPTDHQQRPSAPPPWVGQVVCDQGWGAFRFSPA
jgi:hypothetical protein